MVPWIRLTPALFPTDSATQRKQRWKYQVGGKRETSQMNNRESRYRREDQLALLRATWHQDVIVRHYGLFFLVGEHAAPHSYHHTVSLSYTQYNATTKDRV